jgi:hypothetical protein
MALISSKPFLDAFFASVRVPSQTATCEKSLSPVGLTLFYEKPDLDQQMPCFEKFVIQNSQTVPRNPIFLLEVFSPSLATSL